MKVKTHLVSLDSAEAANAAYCIGVAIAQFRKENFLRGKTILTDKSIKELIQLKEKFERVH